MYQYILKCTFWNVFLDPKIPSEMYNSKIYLKGKIGNSILKGVQHQYM